MTTIQALNKAIRNDDDALAIRVFEKMAKKGQDLQVMLAVAFQELGLSKADRNWVEDVFEFWQTEE